MPKLAKQYYKTKKGEIKLHCYKLTLSKEIVNKANINDKCELNIKVENEKIVIEKVIK